MALTQHCPFAHLLLKSSFILAQDLESVDFNSELRAQEEIFCSLNIVCAQTRKNSCCFRPLSFTTSVSFTPLKDKCRTPKAILILMWVLHTYITGRGQVLAVFLTQKWFHTVHDIIFSLLPESLLLITQSHAEPQVSRRAVMQNRQALTKGIIWNRIKNIT